MKITEVYDGRAFITFHEAKHYYTVTVPGLVERLYQPSVTTILGMKDKSKALLPWAVGAMADKVMSMAPDTITKDVLGKLLTLAKDTYRTKVKDACDVGLTVHSALEAIMLGRTDLDGTTVAPELGPEYTPEMADNIQRSIAAGVRFFGEHDIEVVQVEAPRWSPTYGYIGTGDLIAKFDGELAVLDYKTSKAIYSEYFLQAAAYQMAYTEEFPEQEIAKRIIIHVGRDGRLNTVERRNDTLGKDFHVFKALLDVWSWDKENCGKYSSPAPRILGPLDDLLIQSEEKICQLTM